MTQLILKIRLKVLLPTEAIATQKHKQKRRQLEFDKWKFSIWNRIRSYILLTVQNQIKSHLLLSGILQIFQYYRVSFFRLGEFPQNFGEMSLCYIEQFVWVLLQLVRTVFQYCNSINHLQNITVLVMTMILLLHEHRPHKKILTF